MKVQFGLLDQTSSPWPRIFTSDVNESDTISAVKAQLSRERDCNLVISLVHRGIFLEDAKTLKDYSITEQNFVFVLLTKKNDTKAVPQPTPEPATTPAPAPALAATPTSAITTPTLPIITPMPPTPPTKLRRLMNMLRDNWMFTLGIVVLGAVLMLTLRYIYAFVTFGCCSLSAFLMKSFSSSQNEGSLGKWYPPTSLIEKPLTWDSNSGRLTTQKMDEPKNLMLGWIMMEHEDKPITVTVSPEIPNNEEPVESYGKKILTGEVNY